MAASTRVAAKPEFVVGAGLGNAQRIRDIAKAKGVDIQRATERFTLEASLRRIFSSAHAEKFGFITLKGGSLMYFSENVDPIAGRPTKDIDIELSGYGGTLEELKSILVEILASVPELDDGVRFHVDAMTSNEVAEDRAVPGGSISCPVQIGQSVYTFKVDAGFHPAEQKDHAITREYVSLIPKKLPPFQVPCRPIEFALADKIQACARHGMLNSRLRDYYDMRVFTTLNEIDLDLAATAVGKIFPLYMSDVPTSVEEIEAFSPKWVEQSSSRWENIRSEGLWPVEMPELRIVVDDLRVVVQRILDVAHAAAPKP